MSSREQSKFKKRLRVKENKRLTLQTKFDIVKRIERGEGCSAIGRVYGVNESTIRTMRDKADLIRRQYLSDPSLRLNVKRNDNHGGRRNVILVKMEQELLGWIEENNENGLDATAICDSAQNIYDRLKEELQDVVPRQQKFTATKSWFDRMRQRHNLKYISSAWFVVDSTNRDGQASQTSMKKVESPLVIKNEDQIDIHYESVEDLTDIDNGISEGVALKSTDQKLSAISTFPIALKAFIEVNGYTAQQVFNADESTLFWKRMPRRTYIEKEQDSVHSLDRVTVLLCGNAYGDFKCKPLLVYNSSNPLALKHLSKSTLPVHWKSSRRGSMTEHIFDEWFNNCFCPEVKRYCQNQNLPTKALLILENRATRQAHLETLNPQMKVMFIPAQSTGLLQPMGLGIISNFREYYIKHTFAKIYQAIEAADQSILPDFWQNYTILDALRNIRYAWDSVSDVTMNGAWLSLWPNCVSELSDHGSVQQNELEDIVILGRLFGGEGFDDMTQSDIQYLVDSYDAPLVAEQTKALDKYYQEQERKNEELALQDDRLNVQSLSRAMKLFEDAITYVQSIDANYERGARFAREIRAQVEPYRLILTDKKLVEKQMLYLQNNLAQVNGDIEMVESSKHNLLMSEEVEDDDDNCSHAGHKNVTSSSNV